MRSLAIAPDLVVSMVHPLKGNERSLGLDYRKNERQRAAATQVEELDRLIVTGPVDLVQGGRGVIARYPIHAGKDNAFFGIASAVIDLEKLFSASGFKSDMRVALAISSRAHDGGEARTFFNTTAASDVEPVVITIDIGHEIWTISAAPLKGWHQPYADLGLFRGGLALLAIIIVAPMFWVNYLMKDRHRHILALQDREDRLETVSQRLQLALEGRRVGIRSRDQGALAGQFDAIGVVHDAIEDGISDGRISDDLVPPVDRNLAGDDGRAPLVAIFDDFEEVMTLIVVELFGAQSSRMSRSVLASASSIMAYQPSPLARASSAKSRGAQ